MPTGAGDASAAVVDAAPKPLNGSHEPHTAQSMDLTDVNAGPRVGAPEPEVLVVSDDAQPGVESLLSVLRSMSSEQSRMYSDLSQKHSALEKSQAAMVHECAKRQEEHDASMKQLHAVSLQQARHIDQLQAQLETLFSHPPHPNGVGHPPHPNGNVHPSACARPPSMHATAAAVVPLPPPPLAPPRPVPPGPHIGMAVSLSPPSSASSLQPSPHHPHHAPPHAVALSTGMPPAPNRAVAMDHTGAMAGPPHGPAHGPARGPARGPGHGPWMESATPAPPHAAYGPAHAAPVGHAYSPDYGPPPPMAAGWQPMEMGAPGSYARMPYPSSVVTQQATPFGANGTGNAIPRVEDPPPKCMRTSRAAEARHAESTATAAHHFPPSPASAATPSAAALAPPPPHYPPPPTATAPAHPLPLASPHVAGSPHASPHGTAGCASSALGTQHSG